MSFYGLICMKVWNDYWRTVVEGVRDSFVLLILLSQNNQCFSISIRVNMHSITKKMTFCGSDIYILETLTNDSYVLSYCNLSGWHILNFASVF